jgi:hypothetical protein
VKTYRYVEDDESESGPKKPEPSRPNRRRRARGNGACLPFSPHVRCRLVVAGALTLAGCTGEIANSGSGSLAKGAAGCAHRALPVLKTFETFEYSDQTMRDPFSPSLDELPVGSVRSRTSIRKNHSKRMRSTA